MPWIRRSHRAFFVVLVFQVTALMWIFVDVNFGGHEDQWQSPALKYINAFITPRQWGDLAFVLAASSIIGLYRRSFRWERMTVFCILVYVALNMFLLGQARIEGVPTAIGLPLRLWILGSLASQVLEPPENPASHEPE